MREYIPMQRVVPYCNVGVGHEYNPKWQKSCIRGVTGSKIPNPPKPDNQNNQQFDLFYCKNRSKDHIDQNTR